MRHRKAGRRLNMDTPARDAMFRNMVTSLLRHGQVRTTEPRAKELRRFAERVISLGKKAPKVDGLEGDELRDAQARRLHLIRQAAYWVNDKEVLRRVFGEYAERFDGRPGGYTRIVKTGRRPGDNAPMAVIALVEAMEPAAETEAAAAE
jgi:large subunit ribosomal protein L17